MLILVHKAIKKLINKLMIGNIIILTQYKGVGWIFYFFFFDHFIWN